MSAARVSLGTWVRGREWLDRFGRHGAEVTGQVWAIDEWRAWVVTPTGECIPTRACDLSVIAHASDAPPVWASDDDIPPRQWVHARALVGSDVEMTFPNEMYGVTLRWARLTAAGRVGAVVEDFHDSSGWHCDTPDGSVVPWESLRRIAPRRRHS